MALTKTGGQPVAASTRPRVEAAEARPAAEAGRRRVPADAWAMLAVAAVVVIANSPSLLGVVGANPLRPRSGLVSSATPRWLPGERAADPNDGVTSPALRHRAAPHRIHLRPPRGNPCQGAGGPPCGG